MIQAELFEPRPEVADALNYVVNHDVKAAAYIALSIEGDSTGFGLADSIAKHSNLGFAACFSFVKKYPETFTKAGFASRSLETGGNGRPALHYSAENVATGLPLAGELLEVAEDHDRSLLSVLPYTSHTHSTGVVNTIQILDQLLHDIPLHKMKLPGYAPSSLGRVNPWNTRFKTMLELGIISPKDDKDHSYEVAEDFREFAVDLLERVRIINRGRYTDLKKAKLYAWKTYDNPTLLAKAINRGMTDSSHTSMNLETDKQPTTA